MNVSGRRYCAQISFEAGIEPVKSGYVTAYPVARSAPTCRSCREHSC
jgi:hypothetical protein